MDTRMWKATSTYKLCFPNMYTDQAVRAGERLYLPDGFSLLPRASQWLVSVEHGGDPHRRVAGGGAAVCAPGTDQAARLLAQRTLVKVALVRYPRGVVARRRHSERKGKFITCFLLLFLFSWWTKVN